MSRYTLPLSDPQAELAIVGGKGASLARLVNAGLPVPDGFHVTTAAYLRFVDENDLQPRIIAALQAVDVAQPATLEKASHVIHEAFRQGQVPPDIAGAIAQAYAQMSGATPFVAVRSSATAEDLPDASFAGQQETFLNVQGAAAVLDTVKRCWASLWTARAIGYRVQHAIDQESVSLAVVVQELVPAEAAGIMFTANPMNGRRDQAVINAAWGLGEAVVGGMVTPDTFTVDQTSRAIVAREIADKQTMTVRVAGGTEEQPVSEALRQAPSLGDAQAVELAQLGTEIEALYGMPMDIEWTLADGAFAIVQARPITALPEQAAVIPTEWDLPDPKATYLRNSLAEHLPSPVSPLFATLGLRIANRETDRLYEDIMGIDPSHIFIGDGMYLVMNSYVYAAFRYRLGPKEWWRAIKSSLALMRGGGERWQPARQEFAGVVADWEGKNITLFSPSELLDGARTLFEAAAKYYTIVQTALPAASVAEAFLGRFYNGLVKRKNDPEFTTLLFGFETMPVRAEKSLFDIAAWLKGKPVLANYALQTPTETLLVDFKRETPPEGIPTNLWTEWQDRLKEHFCQFGRTAYEFDFAHPTPAEAPNPQFEAIKLFLEEKATSPYERHQTAVEKREQTTRSILKRLGWPRKGWFEKLLQRAQETGAIREDAIADMGLGHPLIRRMFAELGERFVAGGAIENTDDIYWLAEQQVEELVAALENGQPLPVLVENVLTRKAEWRTAMQVAPPIGLPQKSRMIKRLSGAKAEEKDGKIVLKGIGTSSGQVTAPACVLYGSQDFGKMKPGDVLVAATTTPAWTPLFTMASAVVTDIGGPLSHSSIVAREYGIPAVMATHDATRIIKRGQMITVDGAAGTVILENE